MKTLKIELSVDLSDPKQIGLLQTMLSGFASCELKEGTQTVQTKELQEPEPSQKNEEAPKPKRKRRTAAQIAKDKEAEAATTPPEPAKTEDKKAVKETVVTTEITTAQVRELLSTKVGNHAPTIKAELNRLEAKNVSSLDVVHYEEFVDFLNDLP